MNEPLTCNALTLSRGKQSLLRDFSFSIRAGELTLISGPNGVGKSSLLQTLAGLLTPIAGTIDMPNIDRQQMNYVGHQTALWSQLTVWENAKLIAALHGISDEVVISNALDYFDLGVLKSQFVAHCSAGQKRRLALTPLIVAPGRLWLLDEPWSALDASMQGRLWDLIHKHCAQGGYICVTSHQPLDKHSRLVVNEISLTCKQN